MKIKTKLVSGAILLATLPIIIGSLVIGFIAIDTGKSTLENQAKNQLVSVRNLTADGITLYFETIHNQILTFSNDRMIIDAMKAFSTDFSGYVKEDSAHYKAGMREQVTGYYRNEFTNTYRQSNSGESPNIDAMTDGFDQETIALQHAYIMDNPNPLGEKDAMDKAANSSLYNKTHQKYHPHIRYFLQRFEYYDIFLVDSNTGDIVYSVYKELDFATSLIDGPYTNSAIGEAFNKTNAKNNRDAVVLTDFKPYLPSYESPASFIATPIFDGDKKIGILIFQMPIDKINEVMTHNAAWKEGGLGESGETYLVGEDFTMRSMSRFMLEDKAGYLQLMRDIKLAPGIIKNLDEKNTSIGLQPVETQGTQAALSGKTDFAIFPDYRGVSVLSAYAPLNIYGLKLAIMSEIDEQEALAPIQDLTKTIYTAMMLSTGTALVFSGLAGLLFAIYVIKPISYTVSMLKDIAEGEGDLTQRLNEGRHDEMGELAHWFNIFIGKIQTMVSDLSSSAVQLAASSQQLSDLSEETKNNIDHQHMQTDQVATAMTEMTASVEEVACNATTAAETANNAHTASEEGRLVIEDCSSSIEVLATEIESASEVISQLHNDSEEVGGVLQVIEGIAEQTNLLALNAAIEAARAGESGRGFAVVADEVRTLAKRTQDSTQLIQTIIDRLQAGASKSVDVMRLSQQRSQESIQKTHQAKNSFHKIAHAIDEINSNSMQIASASEEQHATTNEISQNVVSISDSSDNNLQNTVMIAGASAELSRLALSIKTMSEQYKI